MGCTRFPFIALLSLSPHDSRPALVASASGQDIAADPAALLVLLRAAVMEHGVMLAAARAEVEERVSQGGEEPRVQSNARWAA